MKYFAIFYNRARPATDFDVMVTGRWHHRLTTKSVHLLHTMDHRTVAAVVITVDRTDQTVGVGVGAVDRAGTTIAVTRHALVVSGS